MLEQISELVKQYGQRSVVENPEVPNEYNNVVMSEAANTITGGLQNLLSGGGLQSIISLFGGNQGQNKSSILSNPIVSMMIGHLASKLVGKLNLNPAVANSVATNIIPGVITSLVANTRSTDPANNGFDLNDLVAAFTGGNTNADNSQTHGIDLQDLISKFTGGNAGAQQPDLSNIINNITQRSQQQQYNQPGGGITDIISGFFK